jgi:uncharacterized protein
MRVVLDTNVWLSGLLWGGTPDRILQQVEAGTIQVIISEDILDELARTLARPKLQKRLNQLGLEVDAVMTAVRRVVIIVVANPVQVPDLRDPKDEIIIAAAISGCVEFIISGDQDLLVLASVEGIPIVSPRDFLDAGTQATDG